MSLSRELLIVNKRGLHARASAKFVQTVDGFDAEITVSGGALGIDFEAHDATLVTGGATAAGTAAGPYL